MPVCQKLFWLEGATNKEMKGNFNHQLSESEIQPVMLLDLKRQYDTIKDEISEALKRVCDSGAFVLGPEVKLLEQNLSAYAQVDYSVACASGSDAILLALMAAQVGPGDEVIVPSFTFFATASAVTRLGARPVFADIDAVSFNIDPVDVKRKITHRTKAIIPVHLFGQMADMMSINEIAQSNRIVVVEDAAQSIGAELQGRRAGCWGDMGAFSFYPTKNLGGAGDGGLVTTRYEKFAQCLKLYHVHGMEPRYYHSVIGINSRLDSFQAAIINVKLKYLESWTTMRIQNARRYHEMFIDAGLDNKITLPETLPSRRHVWNQYTIRVKDDLRNNMKMSLTERKIGSEIYYPIGLHEQECFKYLGYSKTSLEETYNASREVLSLPIFPELTENEQRLVVKAIKDFVESREARRVLPAAVAKAA
ncbi:MAG: DegT/DnrJ/EryC1/StrS family aminotransferase [Planctomycetaceae bacterium]|jgi:dTDP-4-amino-4,6-dideoxygalactose transaminase|nr:DegT/DnrJ/EryC1/StrS family aminotransferase [Planctomycetaceae bacterium]